MEKKFTPGPWKVEGPNLNYAEQFCFSLYTGTEVRPRWIADIHFYSDHGTEEERANARLIAAAPDLLDALELAHKIIERLASDFASIANRHANYTNGEAKIIESAIAKAIGVQVAETQKF